jgi:hypothetical protein
MEKYIILRKINQVQSKMDEMFHDASNELSRLKAEVEKLKEEPSDKWRPAMGEGYYLPNVLQPEMPARTMNTGSEQDRNAVRFGVAFHTRPEAIEAGWGMYYRAWFKSLSDIKPRLKQTVWCVCYHNEDLDYSSFTYVMDESTYFSSREACRKAVETIGEKNILKYVLRIQD